MSKRVDFYQLSRDPAERVVVMLARKGVAHDARLLVVAQHADQRAEISRALWKSAPGEFLAHGEAGGTSDARQPILLSETLSDANRAHIAILADGHWRAEALQYERVLFLFSEEHREAARDVWRALSQSEEMLCQIHKQDPQGRWREGA